MSKLIARPCSPGKTSNGYAKTNIIIKITLLALVGWRYFFMVNISANSAIMNIIMYTYSISLTSFIRDDDITAQLLYCFQSYLCRIFPTFLLYSIF